GQQLLDTIYKIEKSRRRIGVLASISTAAREPLLVIVIAAVIYAQVKLFGANIGAILIALLFFYRALSALVAMQQQWNNFMQNAGSLENMQDFQKMLEDSKEKRGKASFQGFQRAITLSNVNFYYEK